MAPKHNNVLVNLHFKKDWQNRVKTWFDQAARKERRRTARLAKAARVAPRPVAGDLRPQVRLSTIKYNRRVRAGRGFTLDELKEAGISANEARTIGIALDHRRRNKSLESLRVNAQRLKEYKAKLVVFPRNAKKPKSGDANASELTTATQFAGALLPIRPTTTKPKARKVTADDNKGETAFQTLRRQRADARMVGVRQKRKEIAEAERAEAIKTGKIKA